LVYQQDYVKNSFYVCDYRTVFSNFYTKFFDYDKLKIDKKEADPKELLHQFFRKCPYTYCACSKE